MAARPRTSPSAGNADQGVLSPRRNLSQKKYCAQSVQTVESSREGFENCGSRTGSWSGNSRRRLCGGSRAGEADARWTGSVKAPTAPEKERSRVPATLTKGTIGPCRLLTLDT